MKQNKKTTASLVVDTFGWIACSIVIFFFFTLWLFSYNNIDEPLKDAWSISATVFAALTALGAAYIAANLFNDWKEQHDKQVLAFEAKNIFKLLNEDILYFAAHKQLMHNCKTLPKYNPVYLEAFSKLGDIIDRGQERMVQLTEFSFLSNDKCIEVQLTELNRIITTYNAEHISHFNKSDNIEDELIHITDTFAFNATQQVKSILSSLKNYIFVGSGKL